MIDRLRVDVGADEDSRFARQRLITWWNQDVLAASRVLLIGAGALGNEILKNLALLGVGTVVVADMDHVEYSNLARAVLFREEDIGAPKAEVSCRRALDIFPEMRLQPLVANVLHDLGLGAFIWADVVLAGLDNREARVAINRACMSTGTPWIDGAIERLDGVSRVFLPGQDACYECTMSEIDWKMLDARRSCALLEREEMEGGKTPTTATTSSIVAGFQTQEFLKIVHGLPVEGGTGIVINGQMNDVYPVTYTRVEDCLSHEPVIEQIDLGATCESMTVRELLMRAEDDCGDSTGIELSREIIRRLECPSCGAREDVFRPVGAVGIDRAPCPECSAQRFPTLIHKIDASWDELEMTLAELGLPPLDMVIARGRKKELAYVFDGDRDQVLGKLAGTWRRS